LLLLPFLRQRERSCNDGISMLGYGMSLGLIVVAVMVRLERSLFVPFFDFSALYRVVGPFSSMRTGGGHIGAYICLAMPMALCLPRLRPRRLAMYILALTCILGTYALTVSFARTAYVAGAAAMGLAALGWLWASVRQRRPSAVGLLVVAAIAAGIAGVASSGGMRERLIRSATDFADDRTHWEAGLAVMDRDAFTRTFGMGLGTYQRAMLMRSSTSRPTDFVLRQDGEGRYLSISVATEFYLGQKFVPPGGGSLHVTMRARAAGDSALLNVSICDKVLLYSDQCRGDSATLAPAVWQPVALTLPASGLGEYASIGWPRRPVEFSIFSQPGRTIEIRDIHLAGDDGHELLSNTDFARGLDYWGFTDDTHTAWRMFNQYLMLWFETGALGLAAFLALTAVALAGGLRAAWRGAVTGAAVSGSIAGFLLSCMFDNLLEAPRLATLFFLVCACGLVQWEERRWRPRPAAPPKRPEPSAG
jgi:O-antigen ligase